MKELCKASPVETLCVSGKALKDDRAEFVKKSSRYHLSGIAQIMISTGTLAFLNPFTGIAQNKFFNPMLTDFPIKI